MREMPRSFFLKEYIAILWAFIVMGASMFGGGYAMMPVLEREVIKKRGWVNMDEVLDYFTIGQITPGIIAVNVATFVGYKRKGIVGGVIATIGVILPGVCLMLLISFFLRRFAEYPVVRHAFTGIRIAVGALVLDTALKLFRGVFKNYKSVIICAAAFALSVGLSLSPVYIILGAGVAGFLLFPARPGKTAQKGDGPKSAAKNREDQP
jgi:chromate transporter